MVTLQKPDSARITTDSAAQWMPCVTAGVRTDTLANLVIFSDSRRPSRMVAGKNNEADEDPLAREVPVVAARRENGRLMASGDDRCRPVKPSGLVPCGRRSRQPAGAPGQGATVVQPKSSGATSRTVSANCQRWPARSSTVQSRSPYSRSTGGSSTRAPCARARSN
jgi:hypothetical protein